ncbi:MAG: metal ABC transporter ATP-binding protein [Deltaproteobacteria bacterium]|nr:metal ABC transporter ATP-binding protein [Deltaproteobacteria bacterium]
MTIEALVELKRVAIGYGKKPLVDGIDLAVMPGDFLGLVGPNGAGKSTLLKTILRIIKPRGGEVFRRSGLRIGYVPQRTRVDSIYPLTALEIVRSGGMGPKEMGDKRRLLASATHDQGMKALEQAGVADLAKKSLRDLSGGQQQRTLIARALVRSPDLLILDEPTAGMDLPAEQELLDFVTRLNRDHKANIILVVHQLSLVAGRASRIALINKDLPLFAVGPSEELLTNKRLTELYRHPMEVVEVGGGMIVRARREEER